MRYFRLVHETHSDTPLGYGAAAGRWNDASTPLIYSSNASAIAFMELLSIKGPVVAASLWLLVSFEIDGFIPSLVAEDLPVNWNAHPYPRSTQLFGTKWAQTKMGPFLKVPSCRIPLSSYPEEHNLLINPLYPKVTEMMKSVKTERVSFELNKW